MSKFTPGPWSQRGKYIDSVRDGGETFVCLVTGSSSDPMTQADARLIAAAPEMYEFVRLFAHLYTACITSSDIEQARALLDRINGEAE